MIDGEKDIIKRAIRGEASAFGLLYDRYQPQIYRFIYLKVNSREEAEDLTHQVFLQSWQKISAYRFRGFPFSSWLYRIARNEIIDYYRTKKISIDIKDITIEANPEFVSGNPAPTKIDAILNIEKVREAVKKLGPTEQDIIIFRFVEDLSPQEVADIIDKTPEAVRLIQHRAIKNLRKILSVKEQNGTGFS